MTAKHTPTAAELNAIQAAYMALDNAEPETVKQKVFTAMKQYPKIYLSLSADKTMATVINQGTPCHNGRITIEAALKYSGVDKNIAWHGETGLWIDTATLKTAKGE